MLKFSKAICDKWKQPRGSTRYILAFGGSAETLLAETFAACHGPHGKGCKKSVTLLP